MELDGSHKYKHHLLRCSAMDEVQKTWNILDPTVFCPRYSVLLRTGDGLDMLRMLLHVDKLGFTVQRHSTPTVWPVLDVFLPAI